MNGFRSGWSTTRTIFITGLVLILLSVIPDLSLLFEIRMESQMNHRYTLTNEALYSWSSRFYYFGTTQVETRERLTKRASFKDNPGNIVRIGQIDILVNNKVVDVLSDRFVQVEQTNEGRYFGNVSYIRYNDNDTGTENFVVLVRQSPDDSATAPFNAYQYRAFIVNRDGHMSVQNFSFSHRTPLQTMMLNTSYMGPIMVGYITSNLYAEPTIIYPWVYPFLTSMVGLCLISTVLLLSAVRKWSNKL